MTELIPYEAEITFDLDDLIGWSAPTAEIPAAEQFVVLLDGDDHPTHFLRTYQARQLAQRIITVADRIDATEPTERPRPIRRGIPAEPQPIPIRELRRPSAVDDELLGLDN